MAKCQGASHPGRVRPACSCMGLVDGEDIHPGLLGTGSRSGVRAVLTPRRGEGRSSPRRGLTPQLQPWLVKKSTPRVREAVPLEPPPSVFEKDSDTLAPEDWLRSSIVRLLGMRAVEFG